MSHSSDWLGSELVLASNNKGKLAEFELIFQELQLNTQIIPQGQLAIEDAVEDGLSFIENAIIKARHAARISGRPALSDDSGLVVPLLNGAPGIYSARFAGQHGDDHANNQKLLAELKPLRQHHPQIKAMFVCVLALVRHADDPLPIVVEGIWEGEILDEIKGEEGFGYDPLFLIPTLNCTSAQIPKTEKNKISHRGQAIQKLKSYL